MDLTLFLLRRVLSSSFSLPDEIKLVDDTLRTLSFHAPSQIYDPVMVAKFPVPLPPLHRPPDSGLGCRLGASHSAAGIP